MKLLLTIVLFLAGTLASWAELAPVAATTVTPATTQAQIKAPAFQLPAGTQLQTEINLSDSDVLAMVKRAIPAFTERINASNGGMAKFIKAMDLDELYAAISGIKAVRMDSFTLAQPMTPDAIVEHFAHQFSEAQGWTRLYYSSQFPPGGLFAIYSQDGHSFFAILVNPQSGTHIAVSIAGMVDLEKLAGWMGNVMGVKYGAHPPVVVPPTQPAPAPPANH